MKKVKVKNEDLNVKVENLETTDDNIEVLGVHQKFSIVMYLDKNVDDKYFSRFIKSTERVIRSNPDYKEYLEYIRSEEELDTCAFMKNINSDKAEIQLHHYPFTLYAICVAVANKMMSVDDKISTFILADAVIKLHCDNLVGLVPLSCTIHELVHATGMKIPKSKVFGDYMNLYSQYKDYLVQYEDTIKDLDTNLYITNSSLKMLEHS